MDFVAIENIGKFNVNSFRNIIESLLFSSKGIKIENEVINIQIKFTTKIKIGV